MPGRLTTHLVATTLQNLEAIQSNEPEMISNEECNERAMKVAEAALQAIAVCTKFLLSTHAEARIDGLGTFHLENEEVRFVPDADVVEYALLKRQEPERQQFALRSAFIKNLVQIKRLIPLLDVPSDKGVMLEESADSQEQLMTDLFGKTNENRFDRTVSQLLRSIIRELQENGTNVNLGSTLPVIHVEPIASVKQKDLGIWVDKSNFKPLPSAGKYFQAARFSLANPHPIPVEPVK